MKIISGKFLSLFYLINRILTKGMNIMGSLFKKHKGS